MWLIWNPPSPNLSPGGEDCLLIRLFLVLSEIVINEIFITNQSALYTKNPSPWKGEAG